MKGTAPGRLALVLLASCGGGAGGNVPPMGSGLDERAPLGTLSVSNIETLCTYGVELSRVVSCDGREVESVTSEGACVELLASIADTCEATIGDLETCFEDLAAQSDEEVCGLITPASCGLLGDPDCLEL